jgi:hypothetical protein
MSDRVVVLRTQDPVSFVADACGALAEVVNKIQAWGPSHDELVRVYAELVRALANLERPILARAESGEVRLNIVDHLIERLDQAQSGQINMAVADIADRLHGEITGAVPVG